MSSEAADRDLADAKQSAPLNRLARAATSTLRIPRRLARSFFALLKRWMPRSLFGRALLIVVMPLVITNAVITNVFFDRQWDEVTRRLSVATAGQIAALVELYEEAPGPDTVAELDTFARDKFRLSVTYGPGEKLPDTRPQSFFSVLDRSLRRALSARLENPFWFDTVDYPDHVDIRVAVDGGVLRIIAQRKQVFATNGIMFLVWMILTSLVLLTIAILYLRNQVRPIQKLAEAAEAFGKGQEVPDFKPTGAREVRRAAWAFMDMSARIRRFVDQRTEMLAGVSHDLRTPITRLKLELAMMPESEERTAMETDVHDMEHMLEEYLAFTRGQGGEQPEETDIAALLREIAVRAARQGKTLDLQLADGLPVLTVRPMGLTRCLENLVENGFIHGQTVRLTAEAGPRYLDIAVEDDGPGIPGDKREEVFRPFVQLDTARTKETGTGVGLGLSIARDIAHGHGGKLTIGESALGGARVVLRLPV